MDADEQKATLYDFAYVDEGRAKSLVAQLHSGINVSVQKSHTETKARTLEGGVNLGIAGKASIGHQGSDGDLKIYEAHDIAYMDLINGLRDAGYLKENPSDLDVGDIVLLSGKLALVNFDSAAPLLKIFTTLISTPNAKGLSQEERRKQGKTGKLNNPEIESAAAVIDAVLSAVPMTIQVFLQTSHQTVWGLVNVANFREPVGNITLKYGSTLPREWYMLALTDVVGDATEEISNLPDTIKGLMSFSKDMRPHFGRPDGFIGVTPLLLFRKLSK